MSSCISAIGTANPKYRILQDDIYPFMVKAFGLDDTSASRLKQIYNKSGIDFRYSVLPDFGSGNGHLQRLFGHEATPDFFPGTAERMKLYQREAPVIAAEAAENCFKHFGPDIHRKITHLITVSCTGMYAPGIDIHLVELLGLERDIERTCINFMGCYGALNALKTADYICRAEMNAKVLVVCIELCTLHFQKENTLDNWVANSLFSDGAAAVLVENSRQHTGSAPRLNLDTFYSEFLPAAKNEMGWFIGDHGFEMKLTSKVSKMILKHIPTVAKKLLMKAALDADDVDIYAVHPGGRKILEAAETGLGFASKNNVYSYDILREYGNMSSASILFVLQKIWLDDHALSESTVVALAFGPGLTVESMVLTKTEDA